MPFAILEPTIELTQERVVELYGREGYINKNGRVTCVASKVQALLPRGRYPTYSSVVGHGEMFLGMDREQIEDFCQGPASYRSLLNVRQFLKNKPLSVEQRAALQTYLEENAEQQKEFIIQAFLIDVVEILGPKLQALEAENQAPIIAHIRETFDFLCRHADPQSFMIFLLLEADFRVYTKVLMPIIGDFIRNYSFPATEGLPATPFLAFLCIKFDEQRLRHFVSLGFSLNIRFSVYQNPPLHHVVANEASLTRTVLDWFMDHGLDLKWTDCNQRNLLAIATQTRHFGNTNLLLDLADEGQDIGLRMRDVHGNSPLLVALTLAFPPEILVRMIKHLLLAGETITDIQIMIDSALRDDYITSADLLLKELNISIHRYRKAKWGVICLPNDDPLQYCFADQGTEKYITIVASPYDRPGTPKNQEAMHALLNVSAKRLAVESAVYVAKNKNCPFRAMTEEEFTVLKERLKTYYGYEEGIEHPTLYGEINRGHELLERTNLLLSLIETCPEKELGLAGLAGLFGQSNTALFNSAAQDMKKTPPNYREACRKLEIVVGLYTNPTPQVKCYYALGICYTHLQKPTQARMAFEAALFLRPRADESFTKWRECEEKYKACLQQCFPTLESAFKHAEDTLRIARILHDHDISLPKDYVEIKAANRDRLAELMAAASENTQFALSF